MPSPMRERRDRDDPRDVFINCPFSSDYQVNFQAIVFTVVRSGFKPRCALETDDGGEIRLDKICKIIFECPYSVHDISKTEPDSRSKLPRFNMPFELGLYLGAKRFGGAAHRSKRTLIFDRDLYRYQTYISDIAGQDIHSHKQQPGRLNSGARELAARLWQRSQSAGRQGDRNRVPAIQDRPCTHRGREAAGTVRANVSGLGWNCRNLGCAGERRPHGLGRASGQCG